MTLELAIRLTEILLALAFIQQSLEHIFNRKDEQALFLPRIILSILLLNGLYSQWLCLLLLVHGIIVLKRFQGPYNGGSDRMSLLVLASLSCVHWLPSFKEYILGYLALHLILSYFLSGFFKVINPEWWTGQALQDLFRYSIFPTSEGLRTWADRPRLLLLASWITILFELCFPLVLLSQEILMIGLVMAMVFHIAITYCFGFNRFIWVWLAAYPSLLWFQEYISTNLFLLE